jgi:hypothetical protein
VSEPSPQLTGNCINFASLKLEMKDIPSVYIVLRIVLFLFSALHNVKPLMAALKPLWYTGK